MFKKLFLTIILTLSALTSPTLFAAESPIYTLKTMADIVPYIDAQTLVIFDLDHTVFEGKNYGYGHANWFYDQIEKGKARGIDEKTILSQIFPHWLYSQKTAAMKPVEAITPRLIAQFQKQGYRVMGLTSRQVPLADITIRQLKDIGIDFSSKQLPHQDFSIHFASATVYKNGVIFSSDYNDKGEVLKAYLQKMQIEPEKIVMIDDSKRNLQSVIKAYEDKAQVVGLYYPLVNEAKAKHWDSKGAHDAYCSVYRQRPELKEYPLDCPA